MKQEKDAQKELRRLRHIECKYKKALELGTSIYVERWGGARLERITGVEYDKMIESSVAVHGIKGEA